MYCFDFFRLFNLITIAPPPTSISNFISLFISVVALRFANHLENLCLSIFQLNCNALFHAPINIHTAIADMISSSWLDWHSQYECSIVFFIEVWMLSKADCHTGKLIVLKNFRKKNKIMSNLWLREKPAQTLHKYNFQKYDFQLQQKCFIIG